jgi:hypothetical protein
MLALCGLNLTAPPSGCEYKAYEAKIGVPCGRVHRLKDVFRELKPIL